MNYAYLAAVVDESSSLHALRNRNTVRLNIYLHNRGLAEELREEFGGSLTTVRSNGFTQLQIERRESLIRLLEGIHPHIKTRRQVIEAALDVLKLSRKRKPQHPDRVDAVAYFRRQQEAWLEG